MKRLISGVIIAFMFALCGSWILRGQEPSPKKLTVNTGVVSTPAWTVRGDDNVKTVEAYRIGSAEYRRGIVSRSFDGCNTTTCIKGGGCTSTLVACVPSGYAIGGGDAYYQPAWLAKPAPQAEAEPAKSICGMNSQQHTPNIDLLQVSCLDFDEMRRVIPEIPWPVGKATQVLVHVRQGDTAWISVDGVNYRRGKLGRDAWGRLVTLIQFEGSGFTAVDVRVTPAEIE